MPDIESRSIGSKEPFFSFHYESEIFLPHVSFLYVILRIFLDKVFA